MWLANSGVPPDTLTTVEQLDNWFGTYAYTGRRDGTRAELPRRSGSSDHCSSRLLTSDLERTVELVNQMLVEAQAVPQLVRHDGFDWHVHAVPSDSDLITRIKVETGMAMIDVIRAGELSRLGVCADDECRGSSPTCPATGRAVSVARSARPSNAVAAYRARQAATK